MNAAFWAYLYSASTDRDQGKECESNLHAAVVVVVVLVAGNMSAPFQDLLLPSKW